MGPGIGTDTENPKRISGGYAVRQVLEVSSKGPRSPEKEPAHSFWKRPSWGGGVGPGKAVTKELFEPGLQTRQGISPLHVGGREFSPF